MAELIESERHLREIMRSMPPELLGQRVRRQRTALSLSIRDLAKRALVSKTSIAALEGGKPCRPSTLARICEAMGLHLERLLTTNSLGVEPIRREHLHADDRWYRLEELTAGPLGESLSEEDRLALHKSGITAQMLMLQNIPTDAGFLAGVIELSKATGTRSHPGNELVFVIKGKAKIRAGERCYVLQEGESLYISEGEVHSYAPVEDSAVPIKLLSIRVH